MNTRAVWIACAILAAGCAARPSRIALEDAHPSAARTRVIDHPDGIRAVEGWLDRYAADPMLRERIGAVMPVRTLILARGGDLASASARRIDLYGEIDRFGSVWIPEAAFAELDGIFERWGTEVSGIRATP